MKQSIAIAIVAATIGTIGGIGATVSVGASTDTRCWDEYNMRGTRKHATVSPEGVTPQDCTPAEKCLFRYRASDGKKVRWLVPYGQDPAVACAPADATTTTTTTTTAPDATTTTTAPADSTTTSTTTTTAPDATTTTTAPATTTTTTTAPATTTTTTTAPATTSPATTSPATTSPATTSPATTKPSSSGFAESFDTAASLDQFVFEIREGRSFNAPAGMDWTADHAAQGDSCGSPDTQRPLDSRAVARNPDGLTVFGDDLVRAEGFAYWCPVGGDHLMTSFNAGAYFHLDFRPDRTFTDVTRICWDQNLTSMGGKWTELTVVPLDTFNANNQQMNYVHPDSDTPGKSGGRHLPVMDGVWKGEFRTLAMNSSNDRKTFRGSQMGTKTQDKKLRTQHCVTNNLDGTVTMERTRHDGKLQTNVLPGVIPSGDVMVVFSDVGYNPNKRNDHDSDENTWHWDNLTID